MALRGIVRPYYLKYCCSISTLLAVIDQNPIVPVLPGKTLSSFDFLQEYDKYRITSNNSRPLMIPAQGTRQNYIGKLGKSVLYSLNLQSKNSQRIVWDCFK